MPTPAQRYLAASERFAQSRMRCWKNLLWGSAAQLTINLPHYQGEKCPVNTDGCTKPHRTEKADNRHQKKQFLDVFCASCKPLPFSCTQHVTECTRRGLIQFPQPRELRRAPMAFLREPNCNGVCASPDSPPFCAW